MRVFAAVIFDPLALVVVVELLVRVIRTFDPPEKHVAVIPVTNTFGLAALPLVVRVPRAFDRSP